MSETAILFPTPPHVDRIAPILDQDTPSSPFMPAIDSLCDAEYLSLGIGLKNPPGGSHERLFYDFVSSHSSFVPSTNNQPAQPMGSATISHD